MSARDDYLPIGATHVQVGQWARMCDEIDALRLDCTIANVRADRLEAEVAALKGDSDEPHLIEFRDDGWTIQHTLAERQQGTLFDCPRSKWKGGDPGVRGRFVLVDDRTYGEAL